MTREKQLEKLKEIIKSSTLGCYAKNDEWCKDLASDILDSIKIDGEKMINDLDKMEWIIFEASNVICGHPEAITEDLSQDKEIIKIK